MNIFRNMIRTLAEGVLQATEVDKNGIAISNELHEPKPAKIMTIDIESISKHPGFEKLNRIPSVYYKTWLEKHGGTFNGKKVLDFGCGDGIVSVGLSLFCDVESVLGVDIGSDYLKCEALLRNISPQLEKPGNVIFRTAPPVTSLGHEEFDVAVSWSVMEHVSQDIFDQQVKIVFDALKPGGYCVFQIAPLYYSPFGSHLFGLHDPWSHLTLQIDILEARIKKSVQDELIARNYWDCFITLNKFTSAEFLRRFTKIGLTILDVYETYVSDIPDERLCEIFSENVLKKEQMFIVCRKNL
jgi:SAM-dependent methyltransferase